MIFEFITTQRLHRLVKIEEFIIKEYTNAFPNGRGHKYQIYFDVSPGNGRQASSEKVVLVGNPTRTTFLTSRQPRSQNTQYNHFTSIPYIQGTSEKIRRVLNEAGVKVAMKPIHTIGRILPSPKDPPTLEEKSCLVYQVPCFDCDFVYIGQTKRDLKSRLAEHKLAIRNQEPEKSALCEHSIQFDHLIDWNNSKVLKTEAHYSKRLTSEAWFINSHPHVMNRSDGDSLPRVYRRLITS